MVVVPKRDGKIRICNKQKPLNKSMLCEIHPFPKVEDTLVQLSGAKLVSKLDINSEFWQIPPAKSSEHLTTFITLWKIFHKDDIQNPVLPSTSIRG